MRRNPDRPALTPVTDCSRCGYSLEGLQASGLCPECGFAFDELSFILEGITRGVTGSMNPWRSVLWIVIAIVGTFGFGPGIGLMFDGGPAGVTLASSALFLWLCTVVYLIWIGRTERGRFEYYAFGPDGFGPCARSKDVSPDQLAFVRWREVESMQVESIGTHWQRIRLGKSRRAGGQVAGVVLDIGFRGSAADVAEVLERLSRWLPDVERPSIP
ncbi:MAG: hypothetical protein D8M59_12640 [Planctomycetes bacterium]|nr:hypothetical protein [Planctomycetota bacterium]NOG53662.1 hypothetical protein [Planctomycetota bacterium]